ncbi:MAG: ABC-2 type transport system ATP-binding protein [Myxococcota bacterium]|jgi:ABC-2 type transport system ATP-binding protein
MTAMIEVSGLRKFYGQFEALKDISFTVGKGEIVGLLGPNGAGKSTTMKILTGYISATSGSYSVAGFDGYSQSLEARRNIGYLPETNPLYPDMGIVEYLKFVCEIRKIARRDRKKRIDHIVEVVGLGPMIRKNIGELSKGYRQRVGLAQALIHEPRVLILDEPTSGLDPNQIVEIRNLIKELGKEHTIILSTHNLPEVRMTCDRVIIIARGEKVADGTADELELRGSEESRIIVTARINGGGAEAALAGLRGIAGVERAEHQGAADGAERFVLTTSGGDDVGEAVYQLATRSDWTLRELRRDVMDLEKIFYNLTQQ